MEISVVTPAKQLDDIAFETIKSVANQNANFNYEHIIVVDKQEEKLPKSYIDKNYSITYIKSERKLGPSSSRNEGIEVSKGKIICFLDADDLWDVNHLTNLKLLYEKNDHIGGVSVGGYTFGKTIKKHKKITAWHHEGFLSINSLSWNVIGCPSGFSFRRKYKNYAIFSEDLKWCEDFIFYLNLMIKTDIKIYRSNKFFYWYRVSDNQVTYKPNKEMLDESKLLLQEIFINDFKKILNSKDSLSLRLQIKRSLNKASKKPYFIYTFLLSLVSPFWLVATIIKTSEKIQ